jgi:MSHA biogenesis protein MshO
VNIFNTDQTNFDIYEQNNIAKITKKFNAGGPDFSDDQLRYNNGGTNPNGFNAHSPNQRFVIFDDVVSFVCDRGSDELLRYATYGLTSDAMGGQPVTEGDFGGGDQVVADDLDTCALSYDPGAATRQGLLQVEIGLTNDGETVELFGQVHVVNAP